MTDKKKKPVEYQVEVSIQEFPPSEIIAAETGFLDSDGNLQKPDAEKIPALAAESINAALAKFLVAKELKLQAGTLVNEMTITASDEVWYGIFRAQLLDPNHLRYLSVGIRLGRSRDYSDSDGAVKAWNDVLIEIPETLVATPEK